MRPRTRPTLGLALGLTLGSGAGGPAACTSSSEPRTVTETNAPPAVPRNSDGSPQILPAGPPSRPPYTLVLPYDDFGPQALAFGLLGMEWWQWEAGGSWEPGDRFDIRVVVYRGPTLAAIQTEYPTIEGRADYRYVSYDDAMAYFERSLAEIEGEPSLLGLYEELAATRARVRQSLGGAPSGSTP